MLHHLGHQRGDLNIEFFLEKKYNKMLKHKQSKQNNNYILNQLSKYYSLSRQNKTIVNNDPKCPVLSVKRIKYFNTH